MDLTNGSYTYVGQLDDRAPGKGGRLVVSSFVFLEQRPPPRTNPAAEGAGPETPLPPPRLTLQAEEVAAAWWVDIGAVGETGAVQWEVPAARYIPALRGRGRLQVGAALFSPFLF